MSMNDLLSDMLSRIRNGQSAKLSSVLCPYSNLLDGVLSVLKAEGYIADYDKVEHNGHVALEVELKYSDGVPVIREMKRVSTPGRREYSKIADLKQFYNGLGVVILSTSQGVLADHEARKRNVGGEVLCNVF